MTETNDQKQLKRREFLQNSAAFLTGAAAISACNAGGRLPEPDSRQLALRRKADSHVHVSAVGGYDESLKAKMLEAWKIVGPDLKNKSVFLKLNLVDYRKDIPCCTNAAVLDAAIQVIKEFGAKEIATGDGPALSRETHEIADQNGVLAVCRKHDIEFVDLNTDNLIKVENPLGYTEIKEFLLPESAQKADLLISVPKLKTHHWALMTASLKNMFGVLPGRKYGWPKNILHVQGINASILDIVAASKPDFAIVDAVICMEGDGPLHGTPKALNAIVLGDDLTAVDTVCAELMQLPAGNIVYLRRAGQVLGNNNLETIKLSGEKLDLIKQKFELPPTFEADGKAKDLSKLAKGAEQGIT